MKQVMNMEALYTEEDQYTKEVVAVMSQAGLIPHEEEISFEDYIRETSQTPSHML